MRNEGGWCLRRWLWVTKWYRRNTVFNGAPSGNKVGGAIGGSFCRARDNDGNLGSILRDVVVRSLYW